MVGGSERYYFDLTNLLESHGHTVIPFSMQDSRNRETPYSDFFVSHVDYSKNSIGYILKNAPKIFGKTVYSLESKHKMQDLIRRDKPDIAHIHMIDHQISPSILDVLRKNGIPMIQTLHEYKLICPNYRLYIEKSNEVCERCKGGKYYNTVIHKCLKNSLSGSLLASFAMYVHKLLKIYENNIDTFIVPSRFSMKKMKEFGIDANKLKFLPNMVDINAFTPNYDHSDYILYFGRLAREKGLVTLLEAMKKFPRTRLLIAGTGEMETEIEMAIEKQRMTNVQLLGYITGSKLISLIEGAQFVVVPSEWYETFGLIIVESYACGKPVIGADIGGISELINQDTGLLFRPGNSEELTEKLNHYITHPDLVKEHGRNARKFVEENFAPSLHYERIFSLYQKLMAKG
jgi:glycosyltransferase involved in cell wall biosynthesis